MAKSVTKKVTFITDTELEELNFLDAVSRNKIKKVQACLHSGVNPNCYDENFNTGIHIAIRQNYYKIFNLLLVYPATDVNFQNWFGITPLNRVCAVDKYNFAKLLLQRNANINIPDRNGYTPLHTATMWNYEKIIKLLLKYKADVNAENQYGQTPLYIAVVLKSNIKIAMNLVQYGANINVNNGKMMPILFEFILANPDGELQLEILEWLLDAGINIDMKDINIGSTALHMTAVSGCSLFTEILLREGINYQSTDISRRTALDVAERFNQKEVVRMLLNWKECTCEIGEEDDDEDDFNDT